MPLDMTLDRTAPRVRETHSGLVLLVGDRAYKLNPFAGACWMPPPGCASAPVAAPTPIPTDGPEPAALAHILRVMNRGNSHETRP